jgi:hypothetical protein
MVVVVVVVGGWCDCELLGLEWNQTFFGQGRVTFKTQKRRHLGMIS